MLADFAGVDVKPCAEGPGAGEEASCIFAIRIEFVWGTIWKCSTLFTLWVDTVLATLYEPPTCLFEGFFTQAPLARQPLSAISRQFFNVAAVVEPLWVQNSFGIVWIFLVKGGSFVPNETSWGKNCYPNITRYLAWYFEVELSLHSTVLMGHGFMG